MDDDDLISAEDIDSEVEKQTEIMNMPGTVLAAFYNADEEAIDKLVANDPKVLQTRGAVGECPIHMLFLCGAPKHLEIAQKLLLQYPARVTDTYNKQLYRGENVLHIAIIKRNLKMVEWLLDTEALEPYRKKLLNTMATGDFFKINQPSYYAESPLGFACGTNQWDIAEILLEHGADMDVTDSIGNTILHMLVFWSLSDIYAKFKARWIQQRDSMNIFSILRLSPQESPATKEIAIWNRLNHDNFTPLTFAANLSRTTMFSWLLHERSIVQWSYGDVSCVIHPLDQLDLSLDGGTATSTLSVLEVIVKNNDTELVHPILTSLIDKKWKHFVHHILVRRFLVTLAYLLVFLVTTVTERTRPIKLEGDTTGTVFDIDTVQHTRLRGMICSVGHVIVLTGAILKGGREIREMVTMGLDNYLHTTGSIFLENCLACMFCLSILIAETLRYFAMHDTTVILAFASLLGWTYMFCFIMPFRFTGPFLIMIYKMLFTDVLRFCVIYMIFLAGFSQSFFVLFDENGFHGYVLTIKQCFLGLMGDFDLDFYIEGAHPFITVSFLILYVVVVTILLLNLLIAMMGDTYSDVKRSAKKLWHLERARIALDVERGMSTDSRKSKENKYWVDVKGARYLQVQDVKNTLFETKNDEDE